MITVDLEKMKKQIASLAKDWFEVITNLPGDIRTDEKERTGIQVLVREPGTRNLIYFSVASPSDAAKVFSVEKAIRAHVLGNRSSQNGANPEKLEFAGCVSLFINGAQIQASVSGLKSEEDVFIAVMILSCLSGLSPAAVCKNIKANGGELPACFVDKAHYLYPFVRAKSALDFIPPSSLERLFESKIFGNVRKTRKGKI